jgi:hypothetical protein
MSDTGHHHSETDADNDRIAERAHLLPEELAVGSDDPAAQAEQILAESDRRTDEPEQTQQESVQANEKADEGP